MQTLLCHNVRGSAPPEPPGVRQAGPAGGRWPGPQDRGGEMEYRKYTQTLTYNSTLYPPAQLLTLLRSAQARWPVGSSRLNRERRVVGENIPCNHRLPDPRVLQRDRPANNRNRRGPCRRSRWNPHDIPVRRIIQRSLDITPRSGVGGYRSRTYLLLVRSVPC